MDWIKQMSLKKALFTLTFISLSIAIALSVIAFLGCSELRNSIAPQGVTIDPYTTPATVTELPTPSERALWWAGMLEILQLVLPILIFVVMILITSLLFYRLKIKEPLAILTDGAKRIMANNLDFTIDMPSLDELGQLCAAFETMRKTLLSNNQELWRQAEERKRLNAAFSHDLRNPVTVLKGSVKLLRQGTQNGKLTPELLTENLMRIEDYTGRIERYIDAMSSVQRLEQVPLRIESVDWNILVSELKNAVCLIAMDSKINIHFGAAENVKEILFDKSVLFQIAENLVINALRFANTEICITCSLWNNELNLSVADDGSGFPYTILKNGVQPFQKGNEEADHFGMGLYICSVLCQKHGGSFEIDNGQKGSIVKAKIKLSNP